MPLTAACQVRTGAQRRQLGLRHVPAHRRHAAVGAGEQPLGRHERSASAIVSATSSGVSTRSVATSITPTSTSLPGSSRISSIGTCELRHSSETWSMRLAASAGKVSSYWRHSDPSVALPVDVGLDAVAVADMHRGLARQALGRALQRRHAPVAAPRPCRR